MSLGPTALLVAASLVVAQAAPSFVVAQVSVEEYSAGHSRRSACFSTVLALAPTCFSR